MKELDRTTEPYWTHCSNECWMKVGEGWVCWVQHVNMWQNCSLWAVQRKTAFVDQSWWPEFHMFGSMPWCSFPWHTLLPRLMQNNCCTVYSLNLIHEFTSLFRRSDFCRFAKESLPTEVGKGRHWTSVFFCGCTSRSQDSLKASPMAIFKWKNLIGQLNHTEPIARMNVEWKLEKAEYAEFNMSTCGKIAVCQLCRERQPLWKSHDGLNWTCLDQCHGVRFHGTSTSQGWRKIIGIRHSQNDPWVYIRVFNQPASCRFA